MQSYAEMSREELLKEKECLEKKYKEICDLGLRLDMSRGKPAKEQLDLSMPMLDVLNSKTELKSRMGTDIRNYGMLDGINEAKELIAEMVDCKDREKVIVYGNASLNIMYDCIARSMIYGVCGSTPFLKLGKVKFLCPVPGYDRHFAITESFGIEMINVPLYEDGPDMDMVEKLVSEDVSIKGIWCVPKYSNPMGSSYSDETVRRLANLKPKARGFRIYWDNAYCVHHLYEEEDKQDKILDIIEECEKAGNPDLVYEFCSTSKVTFSGAGISGLITSPNNKADIIKYLGVQTIGFDKVNQLRHVKFLKDRAGIDAHMMKHAAIIRPKFEMLLDKFDKNLEGLGVGSWTRPRGGYFITYFANDGCAKRIVKLAKDAGVVMTGAGAPYPYKNDPKDSVIRIAPSLPSIEELSQAGDVFMTCVKLASVEKLLEA